MVIDSPSEGTRVPAAGHLRGYVALWRPGLNQPNKSSSGTAIKWLLLYADECTFYAGNRTSARVVSQVGMFDLCC